MERRLAAEDLQGALVHAAHVQQSVKALGDTLERLLLAARYEAGTFPISLEAVDVSAVLSRVLEVCQPPALAGGVGLEIRVGNAPVLVRTDEQTLLLILMNLVSNAVKFADTKGKKRPRVVVRLSRRRNECRIVILDNGIGIPEEHVEAIWEPFFQVENSERNREAGIGLGLYLVKRAVARLDGHDVTVSSSSGRWTRFVLSVPIATHSSEKLVSPLTSLPVSEIDLQGMCVLIIEDDVQARDALQTLLLEWGAKWVAGPVFSEAMRAELQSLPSIDALIVDYRLPGEERGDRIIAQVRGMLGYQVDAVLVTAEADQAVRLKDQLPERTKLLLKPFEPRVLATILRAARLRREEKAINT